MKMFLQRLVAQLAASAYAEIEGVEMTSSTVIQEPMYSADTEQLRFQQI
jgi:hypothetical protein